MRILVLTKRRTSSKDLLLDRFGRVYELSRGLAQTGHEVAGVAIGYREEPEVPPMAHADRNNSVQWQGLTIDWCFPWRTFSAVSHVIERFRPDILWCSADALQVIAGTRLARSHRIPVVVDLYDNYEAFWPTRLPGILQAFRKAVRTADGVTCVSKPLAQYIRKAYRARNAITVIENGVSPRLFRTLSRMKARSELGYTEDQILVGMAGSLSNRRGLRTLVDAFESVRRTWPNSRLVLAGAIDRGTLLPSAPAVDYLGELPPERIPRLLTALDVGVIYNRDNAFSRYCYPLKLPEMQQAGIPIVAANVGIMRQLSHDQRPFLFRPGDEQDLADAILQQINDPKHPRARPQPWKSLASSLEGFLSRLLNEANDPERSA